MRAERGPEAGEQLGCQRDPGETLTQAQASGRIRSRSPMRKPKHGESEADERLRRESSHDATLQSEPHYVQGATDPYTASGSPQNDAAGHGHSPYRSVSSPLTFTHVQPRMHCSRTYAASVNLLDHSPAPQTYQSRRSAASRHKTHTAIQQLPNPQPLLTAKKQPKNTTTTKPPPPPPPPQLDRNSIHFSRGTSILLFLVGPSSATFQNAKHNAVQHPFLTQYLHMICVLQLNTTLSPFCLRLSFNQRP
mmetsp:Transcript_15252/g.45853  ORF Transcript_15252/g.45853 Transcript_15252/m.45853 type:complete len:249 (-) Transcript_15252:56-802(-)